MSDIVDLGSSKLDERTNALLVQCKSAPMGANENDAPSFENTPVYGSGGVTAIPWPRDERGSAQAIIDESLPGQNGAVVAWRDTREAKVVASMGPGESCLHSTGPGFDSRFFCKKQLAAMIVGDDCALVMDRENKKFTITAFGCHFEMSEANGIVLSQGGVMIQLKDLISLMALQTVLGGRIPLQPVTMGPVGATGVGSPGVFIGG
jgi:hypothetical protein